MNVSVIGLGRLGSTAAVQLARLGHMVIGFDAEPHKSACEHREPWSSTDRQLERLIEQESSLGRFRRAADLRAAVIESDVSLICIPPLSNANGSQNLRELDRVFRQIGTTLARKRDYHLIVVRSTVLPGTTEGRFGLLVQQHSGRRAGTDFGLCLHPTLLSRTAELDQIDHPQRIVIGELDSRSGDTAQQLYKDLNVPVIRTSIPAAEMLDYAASAFQAVKITFANEVGQLCATHGIDGQEVMEYFCLDRELNVSPKYLRPGFAFGGVRLTRDLRALVHRAKEQDVDCPLLGAVLPSNQRQICRAVELIEKTQRWKIGILGLGDKADAADLHENPVLHFAQILSGKGYRVRIFDEHIQLPREDDPSTASETPAMRSDLSKLVCPRFDEVIEDSEVVVLASRDTSIPDVAEMLSEDQILIDLAGGARQSTSAPEKKYASP
jgi:GDP-mannose 6-dehydrogenase